MADLPRGVVTFMFTDVEGSTRLWEDASDSMMAALDQHDSAIDEAVAAHNGVSVKPRGEGDSRFVVFASAVEALAAAADVQRGLSAIEWVTPRPLKVRASLHTGTADLQAGDYYGSAVNRAARIRAIAHGGQTIMSGSTWELVRDSLPDGVHVRDMGMHRLKDLTRPEHVYQMDVDGLETSFPPLASLDAVANNLPIQLTEFVGRSSELEEIRRILGGTRLLTILAPGGTGKTRIAIQAAADLVSSYPNGVYFVGLADVVDADGIVQAIAEAMGLALTAGDDLEAQLLDYLANRRQLLVLDNFEHLLGGARVAGAILGAAPEVTLVVTSRSKLGLSGETVFTIEGLDTAWTKPEDALATSGAELFLSAARRARPDLTVEGEDLDALSQILERTGGMPLAIVLAASWADMLSIQEIAAEVTRSLDFLETTASDVPDRHRSVRAVFDYTWQLLDDRERAVFSALSVFRGGFDRAAAEVVAGASLRDLSALVGKSLVMPSPDTGRYVIHELLRQYAEAELEQDAETHDRVLTAHAGFFSDVARRAFARFSSADQPAMLKTVEVDLDNMRGAWRRLVSAGDAPGLRAMAGVLWAVYEIRGWYPAALTLFGDAAQALSSAPAGGEASSVAALANALQSWFLVLMGQVELSVDRSGNAVDVLRQGEDPEALWMALFPRALALAYSGQDWTDVAEEGIAVGETLDGPFWPAVFKNWRGGAGLMVGDFDTADRRLREGLAVYESLGEHYWMSLNLQHQAQLAGAQGRLEDAAGLFGRSVVRAREIGAMRVLQLSLTGLGDANIGAGRHEEAEAALIDSLVVSDQMGLTREMLGLLLKFAQVRAATGRIKEAVEILACIVADPTSAQLVLFEQAPIAESARAEMEKLESKLETAEYAEARAAGSARSFRDIAQTLIDARSSP